MGLATMEFSSTQNSMEANPRIRGVSHYRVFLNTKLHGGQSHGSVGLATMSFFLNTKLHGGQPHGSVGLATVEFFATEISLVLLICSILHHFSSVLTILHHFSSFYVKASTIFD